MKSRSVTPIFLVVLLCTILAVDMVGQNRSQSVRSNTEPLVFRDLTMSLTVKGSGTEQVSTHETVSWNIDRTYIASTVLNKAISFSEIPPTTLAWLGQLTKEIFLDDKSKQGMYFFFDKGVDPGDDQYIHAKVVVDDTKIRRIVTGRDKDGNLKYQIDTYSVQCNFIADTFRLAHVRIDNAKGIINLRFPLGATTRTFGRVCTQTTSVKGKLTPPDPPDDVAPGYVAPEIPSTGKYASLLAIDIPLAPRSFESAQKSFEFDTGELETEMQVYGVKAKIKVSASYKFGPSK